ncbi:hypothetical protein [Enterobacter kobei]|uniref:hypothetical protein n=1 Tax=Enterobacter kobei TaxID=208224 RepID=UPI002A816619|nr:hypothetical protein [Enterobacter kobei]
MNLFRGNIIKNFLLLLVITISLYFLLCSGVLFQYFTSVLNAGNCYECSMRMDYISKNYISYYNAWYMLPSLIIASTLIFFRKRLASYLLILCVAWLSLTVNDVVTSFIYDRLSLNDVIINLLYNLIGAMLISLFLCVINSTIYNLYKKKRISLILCATIPLIASILISVMVTLIVYLIYAREPVYVEMELMEEANVGYEGAKDDNESFGFLNDKNTSTPTFIDVMKAGELSYNDVKGMSSASVFVFSGCYATPELMKNAIEDKSLVFTKVNEVKVSTGYPMMGFIDGKSIKVSPGKVSQLYLSKKENQYMLAGRASYTPIQFDTKNNAIRSAFAIMSLKDQDFERDYTYTIVINNKPYVIRNKLKPLSNKDTNKKMKCTFLQIKESQSLYDLDGMYLTGFLISFKPDDIISFKSSPILTLKSDFSFFKKEYNKMERVYDDITNGKLTSLHGVGISSMKINGKELLIKPESDVIIMGGNLVGLVAKHNKIKIYGDADLLFVENKIMNLRKISVIQDKLESLNLSILDFFKYLISIGLLLWVVRFVYFYFKNDIEENIFS